MDKRKIIEEFNHLSEAIGLRGLSEKYIDIFSDEKISFISVSCIIIKRMTEQNRTEQAKYEILFTKGVVWSEYMLK